MYISHYFEAGSKKEPSSQAVASSDAANQVRHQILKPLVKEAKQTRLSNAKPRCSRRTI